MTICLKEKRENTLKLLINKVLCMKKCTIRFVAKVIGHIISVIPACKYGLLHYRALELEKVEALKCSHGDFESLMSLSDKAKNELKWWKENRNIKNWIHPPPFTDTLYTDASDYAWGVVYNKSKTGGSWDNIELDYHINIKELIAIHSALKCFFSNSKNKHFQIFPDNTTAVACINKMGSKKKYSE